MDFIAGLFILSLMFLLKEYGASTSILIMYLLAAAIVFIIYFVHNYFI